ncbi:MAG TPA: PqqD family protein [Capsulimonadaceae bacterium]|jgi:formylmethanofuran dehydrogenase subunit E-like metal-binding protein
MLGNVVNKLKKLPFLGGTKRPNAKQVLALRPIRNPAVKWERNPETDLVVVTLAYHPYRNWDKLLKKVFRIPTERRVEMSDELSSMVWEMCDGTNTVSAIATHIATKYKLTQRQSEVSVLSFLNTLQGKRLVGVPLDQSDITNDGPKQEPPKGSKGSKGFYGSRKQRSATNIARERGN